MHKLGIGWLQIAVFASVAAMVGPAFADLDTSSWPVAGQSRATRESVTAPSAGDAMRAAWHVTGLPADPTGVGGGVLSSDGYLWFRTGGAGNLYRVNTANGQIAFQVPLGNIARSAPLLTDQYVFVSNGDGVDSGIKVFSRTTPNATPIAYMQNAAVNSGLRSLQLGSVAYGSPAAHQRIYAVRRGTDTYISAWDSVTFTFLWEVTLNRTIVPGLSGSSGLCQLGPLWVDADGKQRMTLCTGNGTAGVVFIVRDDGPTGTITSYTNIAAVSVNGQGALSANGAHIYYNSAWDGTQPALRALNTSDGSIAWSIPQTVMPVSAYVANPAVIGNRIYLACTSGNVAAIDDTGPASYSVAWVFNVGETGEFTNIAAQTDTSGRKYLYCSNGSSHKLYRIEDLGTSAVTLGVFDFLDAPAWGGCSTTVDGDGSVYQFGGANGGLYKMVMGTPPVAEANGPYTASCYQAFAVSGAGSHGVGSTTITNYKWTYGSTVLYDGPNETASVTLPFCNGTYTITLTATDSAGFFNTDTAQVAVGTYPPTGIQFTTVNGPDGVNGDNWKNSLATDGTYLYCLNNSNGRFFRTPGGTCNLVWTELAQCPGIGVSTKDVPPESGSLAYYSGMLVTFRRFGTGDTCYDHAETLVTYDIATDTWTQHGQRGFGGTGFVVYDRYLFANRHAVDTNQGGPLTRADLTLLDNYTCERNGIKNYLSGANNNWMSRVVQLALVTNSDGTFIYGIKNDQVTGDADGDRLFKFNPTAWIANTWGGDPSAAHCVAGTGALWQNWTTNAQTPAVDLGDMPFSPGYGDALVALPAGWKGIIGAKGGLFIIFGQGNSSLEGLAGTSNNQYATFDIATSQWRYGTLPDWSTNGTAAVFFNGEVWIKQGCASATDPNATPTNAFWISTPPPTITVDAGADQTYTLEDCATQAVDLIGTGSAGIDSWTWTDQTGRVLGTFQQLYGVPFLPGTYTITLEAADSATCASTSDTMTLTINAVTKTLPVTLPMDQQVNHDAAQNPAFDVIREEPTAPPDNADVGWLGFPGDPDNCARFALSGTGFYSGPTIQLPNDCFEPVDITNAYIRFEARYYQERLPTDPPAYEDAPLGIRFRNANGTDYGTLGVGNNITWFYGPAVLPAEQFPAWKTCGGPITIVTRMDGDRYAKTAGFDPTKVTLIEFVGADWINYGLDFIDVRNLLISDTPLGACCIDSNTCVALRTQTECTSLGGVAWHAGEDCGSLVNTYTLAGASLPIEDISSTGTQLVGCDDCGYMEPIGFTFSFFGQDITQIGVASNGYLSTDAANLANSGNVTIPNAGAPNDMIAVLWGDWNLDLAAGGGGAFYYQTLGTAPNRRFVVMWKQVSYWGTTEQNTFEAILHEGTNVIELRYGVVVPRSGPPVWGGATTAGVENATGTDGIYVTAETIGAGGDAAGQVFAPAVDDQRTCSAPLLGDMNCDGVVSLPDVALFVEALLGTYNVPGCDVNLADMNQDGAINGLDIQGFVSSLVP